MWHAGPTAESWRSIASEPLYRFSRGSNRFPPASGRYGQGLSLVLRLQGEQTFLDVKAPRETRQLPVRTDHPMAGGDDRDRVSPVGGPDRTCRIRPSDLGRNLAVAPRLAVGNGQQRLPNPLLERRPSEVEGERECPPLPFLSFRKLSARSCGQKYAVFQGPERLPQGRRIGRVDVNCRIQRGPTQNL